MFEFTLVSVLGTICDGRELQRVIVFYRDVIDIHWYINRNNDIPITRTSNNEDRSGLIQQLQHVHRTSFVSDCYQIIDRVICVRKIYMHDFFQRVLSTCIKKFIDSNYFFDRCKFVLPSPNEEAYPALTIL